MMTATTRQDQKKLTNMRTIEIKEIDDYSAEDLKAFILRYKEMIEVSLHSIEYWETQKKIAEEALSRKK